MSDVDGVAQEVVGRLRATCGALPETVEERAWVGLRWRIRTRTFAHVLRVESHWPPSYADAVDHRGPLTAVTFHADAEERHAFAAIGFPWFMPKWSPTIVGVAVDEDTDWDDLAELITESYCMVAPQKLARLVSRAN